MEQRKYARHESRIPAFIRSGFKRRLTQEASDTSRLRHGQNAKNFDRESGSNKKTVTMAPTSRYMTSRGLYRARKPLISSEHQTSILKNPVILDTEYSERVQMSNVAKWQIRDEETASTFANTSDHHIVASSYSENRDDPCASLNLSNLRLCSSHEEPDFSPVRSVNTFQSVSSLSSSHLDDLSLSAALSPKWTSTQRILPHSYTSQTRTFQRESTKAYKEERESPIDTSFSVSKSKNSSSEPNRMSQYQTNYWVCAIPSTLPPSPDRTSPNWDPDREYQSLLDYTYPLRPNLTNAWGLNEHGLQTDQPLQDSGIEVDSFLSSSSLSFLEQLPSRMRQDRSGPAYNRTFGFRDQRKLEQSVASDMRVSRSLNSSREQVGLSLESLDCGKNNFHYKKFGVFSTSRSVPNFIRSTSILPHLGSLGEWDEEFLQLPEQLQEIQDLSQKLKDITEQIRQPVASNWEHLQRESLTSPVQVEKRVVPCVQVPPKDISLAEQTKGLNTRVQVTRDSVRDVEDIVDERSGASSGMSMTDEEAEETQESLLQHLQSFCSNLQQLIQWLHKVTEKMDVLSPPLMDIESVKASLEDYKSFQKEVQAHKPLTTSVLQTGKMLLCCMNSASPFLKDTLMLIERQSCALETHSEHFFSSILSTMDCLTEPNSLDNTAEEKSLSSQDQ